MIKAGSSLSSREGRRASKRTMGGKSDNNLGQLSQSLNSLETGILTTQTPGLQTCTWWNGTGCRREKTRIAASWPKRAPLTRLRQHKPQQICKKGVKNGVPLSCFFRWDICSVKTCNLRSLKPFHAHPSSKTVCNVVLHGGAFSRGNDRWMEKLTSAIVEIRAGFRTVGWSCKENSTHLHNSKVRARVREPWSAEDARVTAARIAFSLYWKILVEFITLWNAIDSHIEPKQTFQVEMSARCSMKLRRRVAAVRRRMFCLWLLILGLALAVLVMPDFLNQDQDLHAADSTRRPFQRLPDPPELEVIVDSLDPALELGVDLAPLKSLQEDQLLFVFPSAKGTRTQPQRKRGYKMLLRGSVKDATASAAPGPVRLHAKSTQREMERESVQRNGFNEALSETISLHRRLPEARHPECFGEKYSELLPSGSVIICFHEEPWSTLMRTVHSVLDTSPKQYLQEVLLVDDLSQSRHLKARLGNYVSGLEGVRLIRSTRRLGVGGCRTMAAAKAKGEVLVFMDSHCECQEGWLEPLLERVAQDRSRVVSPIIDVIDWQTFQYNATQWPVRGVFDWRLDFYWELNPQLQDIHPEEAVLPLKSPALGGGVLAIDRNFFQSVGAYDPGMVLWGAEQIELSIRVWSCGGSMEVVPCSRVAHLSRHHLPYSFPDQDTLRRNKIRVADIWMDTYRKIYYRRDTLAHFIKQSESSNIAERLRLKRSLGCRNFHWFLSTVYPQLYVPQDKPALSGELYNVGTGSCADYPRGERQQGGVMNIAPCSGTGSQHCEFNSEGELRWGSMGSLCMDVKGNRVVLSPCSAHQPTNRGLKWKFIKLSGQLVHQQTQMCVEAVQQTGLLQSRTGGVNKPSAGGLYLKQCTRLPRQQWHFEQLVAPKGN